MADIRAGDTWTYALGGMRYIPQGQGLSAADVNNSVMLDKVSLLQLHTLHILISKVDIIRLQLFL